MWQARQHPKLVFGTVSPGFIDTKLVAGFGAKLQPSEGTVSIRHVMFGDLAGKSGFYWGSDAKRSPLHVGRDPGTPEFQGY